MSAISLAFINLRTNKEIALSMNQQFLNKNPDFQREFLEWDDKMRTRFVETMLSGRAMNPIWTIINPDEDSEEILDGMHRISTALDFLNNKYKLEGKYFSDEIKGKSYDKKFFSDLCVDDQQKIRNYNFVFNQLDSSYHTDANKRRDQYEILNRSSKTLNDYEYHKVLYGEYFELIGQNKTELNELFFKKTDKRGTVESEIIDILVLSSELPSSWSSINSLREKFYHDVLGDTKQSVDNYLLNNRDDINEKMKMIKKIIKTLKDNKFFSDDKKIYNKYYLPYKFIISRIFNKIKEVSILNRHIVEILRELEQKIINVDIQEVLECGSRNAGFQKKLLNYIDEIIMTVLESNKERRLFTKAEINKKLEEQNNVCNICKLSKETYEGDHIVPWSKGGKTAYENLQVLCKDCHYKKV